MSRRVMWTALQWPGSEHLDQCVAADGLVIAASRASRSGWPIESTATRNGATPNSKPATDTSPQASAPI